MNPGAASSGRPVWSRRSLRWAGLGAAVLLIIGAAIALWPARTRVVLLGDSHVRGPDRLRHVPNLFQALREELGPRYEVVAAACPGSSTYDWTHDDPSFHCTMSNAYPERGRPHLPAEIVVILLGSNDAVGFSEQRPIAPQAYAEAMQELVRRVQRDGGERILLLGPPPSPLVGRAGAQRLRDYSKALAALAEQEPSVYMGPDLQEFIDLKQHFAGRRVHMNAAGYRLAAERVARAVRALRDPGAQSPAAEAP